MTIKKIRNMDEFASLSGISRPTISKYFNDPNSVRPSTRDRIETALREYDYRPNIYAMNQNRRLTKNIGIVVPYLADPFFAEIARVIERRCIDGGFTPTLFSSHGEQGAGNIDLEHIPVIVARNFGDRRSSENSGVIDQNINPAKAGVGFGDRRINTGLACDIHFDRHGGITDLGGSLAGAVNIDISKGDASALGNKCFREVTPDAARGSGDQRRFASKPGHAIRNPPSSNR